MNKAPEQRSSIIPVFLPHAGCPHQCIFCDQTAITGQKKGIPSPGDLRRVVDAFLKHKTQERKAPQLAFYGGNFLGLETGDMISLLQLADDLNKAGKIDSIRFSTRPDTVTRSALALISKYPVKTIEIGVQTMDDAVLKKANRGHTAADIEKALKRLQEESYEIGVQLMVGLPGDSEEIALLSGDRIAALSPDFVRIYPTLVMENSRLAAAYRKGTYSPLSLEKAVTLVKKLYLVFQKRNIGVIRMGLQATEDLDKCAGVLAGPYHPSFGHLVHSEIFLDKAMEKIVPGVPGGKTLSIRVHPRSVSKMRGLNNFNIQRLEEQFGKEVEIVPDSTVALSEISIMPLN